MGRLGGANYLRMKSYIPESDAGFNVWQSNFIETAEPELTTWGIATDSFTPVTHAQSVWTPAYAKADNKGNRTPADVTAKTQARKLFEKAIRTFVTQQIANNPKVTDADRKNLGVTVRSGSRTAVPVPTTRPVATVDFSVRLQHSIHFSDEATTGKAKPDGVHGCEIWAKTGGDAPVKASELTYLATDTRTPYIAVFEGDETGKTVYYWLRWVNTRGERGPWSTPVSAVVG